MPSCTIKFCTNNSTDHKKSDGITFHKFPRELQRKFVWISIVRKNRIENNWTPSKFSLICSDHFEDSDLYFTKSGRRRITNDAIPKKNLYTRKPGTAALEMSTNEQLNPIGDLNRLRGDLVQPESAIDFQNEPLYLPKSEDELNHNARPGTPSGSEHDILPYSPNLKIKLEDTSLEFSSNEELVPGDCLISGSLVQPESLIVFQNVPLVLKNEPVDEFDQDARPGTPVESKHVPVDCLNTLSGGMVQPESLIVLQTMPLGSLIKSEDEIDQDARPGTFVDSKHVLDAVTSMEFCDVSRNDTSVIQTPAMERPVFPMSNFENLSKSYLENKIEKQNDQITNNKKKIKILNQKIRRFKKRIVSLRNMIQNVKKLNISFLRSESIVAADMFNVLYRKNKKKTIIYSPALKEFCLTLNKYSPKAYEYTRQSFNTCLPHPKTLTKWKALSRSEPGLAEESFQANPHASNTTLDHSSDESDMSNFPDVDSDTSENI